MQKVLKFEKASLKEFNNAVENSNPKKEIDDLETEIRNGGFGSTGSKEL